MKKFYFIIVFLLTTLPTVAQDKVVLRDSTVMDVQIVETNDKSIFFTYPNESIKNEKSKSVIAYIIYASGRREDFKQDVQVPTISSEEDWEKVIITNNREDVAGLEKVQTLTTSGGSGLRFASVTSAHEKATKKLKQAAAKNGCGIVLIISENFGGRFNNISTITGDAYK